MKSFLEAIKTKEQAIKFLDNLKQKNVDDHKAKLWHQRVGAQVVARMNSGFKKGVDHDQIKTQDLGFPNVSLKDKHSEKHREIAKQIYAYSRAIAKAKTPEERKKIPKPQGASIENIPHSSIATRQTHVSADVVKRKINKQPLAKGSLQLKSRFPIFIRLKNKEIVQVDGHHRTAGRDAMGLTKTRGWVIKRESKIMSFKSYLKEYHNER